MTNGEQNKKRKVGEMFDSIAPTYDRLNHLLSMQIDRLWRRKTVKIAARRTPRDILDVATGTADLALSLAREIPGASVTGVDISENMLAIGRQKVTAAGLDDRISLQVGDAESLGFDDGSFDCVTAAFGVRNFGAISTGLSEMHRVMRPGGVCLVLEFSQPRTPFFATIYKFYFSRVLPFLGEKVSGNDNAYTYLPESVGEFPPPERFAAMMREAGFAEVAAKRLSMGIAYIYIATK